MEEIASAKDEKGQNLAHAVTSKETGLRESSVDSSGPWEAFHRVVGRELP